MRSLISDLGTGSGTGKVFAESENVIHFFIQQTRVNPFTVPGSVFRSKTQRCQPRAFSEGSTPDTAI